MQTQAGSVQLSTVVCDVRHENLIAAVNAPQSRRFAKFGDVRQSRQRLECGGFSTAFLRRLSAAGRSAGCPLGLDAFLGADGAINLFCRRGDADEMDVVGGHRLLLQAS